MANENTTPTKVNTKPVTVTSQAHPERFTQKEVVDTIMKSKAKPLFVADGDAITLAERLRKYGKRQISIVVLGQ